MEFRSPARAIQPFRISTMDSAYIRCAQMSPLQGLLSIRHTLTWAYARRLASAQAITSRPFRPSPIGSEFLPSDGRGDMTLELRASLGLGPWSLVLGPWSWSWSWSWIFYPASSRNLLAIAGPLPSSSCLKNTKVFCQFCSRIRLSQPFSSSSP